MKRKVCVISGTRADYGILQPVMQAIKKDKNLQLQLVATGMHLMKEFGHTIDQIRKDGFNISERIDITFTKNSAEGMAVFVGEAIVAFSKCFKKLKPQIVFLLGDRGEMLSAAIAANYMNIPVAHLHGGEVSGHVDGVVRHAITKLSHIHLAATQESKERIAKLGEELSRIFVVGAPALDKILNDRFTPRETLVKKYRLDETKPLCLLVQHPVHLKIKEASHHIRQSLEAVCMMNLQTIVIYPNADAGGRDMIKEIRNFKNNRLLKYFKSLPHEDYLGLLQMASVLVGNSSSGMIEAASFHVPVVNVGDRQERRERSANVIDVAHDKSMIKKAIQKAIFDKTFRAKLVNVKNVYGDGKASGRIVKILETININQILEKKITY